MRNSVLYTNRPEAAEEWGGVSQYLSPEEMEMLAAEQDRISRETLGKNYYSENLYPAGTTPTYIQRGETLDPNVDTRIGIEDIMPERPPGEKPPEQAMPRLYKAPESAPTIPGPPPGQEGFEDTTRAKFIQHAISEIGYDPLSINPETQAWDEMNAGHARAMKDYRDPNNREIWGIGPPAPNHYFYEERKRELAEKKSTGLQQLKFMMDEFDKQMEWKPIARGGAAIRESGEMIQSPEMPEEPPLITGVDAQGRPIRVPDVQGVVPYTKEEKPEYSPKQAMNRISTIDSTIARLKTTGTVDTEMAIKNPMLVGIIDTKDPEAVNQAIVSLEAERAEVIKYAPKGYGERVKSPIEGKQEGYEKTMKDAKDAIRQGAPKSKVRERLKKMGYTENQLSSSYFNWLR